MRGQRQQDKTICNTGKWCAQRSGCQGPITDSKASSMMAINDHDPGTHCDTSARRLKVERAVGVKQLAADGRGDVDDGSGNLEKMKRTDLRQAFWRSDLRKDSQTV